MFTMQPSDMSDRLGPSEVAIPTEAPRKQHTLEEFAIDHFR